MSEPDLVFQPRQGGAFRKQRGFGLKWIEKNQPVICFSSSSSTFSCPFLLPRPVSSRTGVFGTYGRGRVSIPSACVSLTSQRRKSGSQEKEWGEDGQARKSVESEQEDAQRAAQETCKKAEAKLAWVLKQAGLAMVLSLRHQHATGRLRQCPF